MMDTICKCLPGQTSLKGFAKTLPTKYRLPIVATLDNEWRLRHKKVLFSNRVIHLMNIIYSLNSNANVVLFR